MEKEFRGRKLLVIGGTSGMGFESARRILEGGATVVITGRNAEKTARAQKALSPLGKVEAINADITSSAGLRDLLQTLATQHPDVDLSVFSKYWGAVSAVRETRDEVVALLEASH